MKNSNNDQNFQHFQDFLIEELFTNYQKIISNYHQLMEQSDLRSSTLKNNPVAKLIYYDIKRRKNHTKRIKIDLKKLMATKL